MIKISEIVNAEGVLKEISKNKKIPTRVAYRLFIMLSSIEDVLKFYEEKKRALFNKYGVAEGEMLVIPEDKKEIFMKEINEIGDLDCEKDISKIDIELDVDLGISPSDVSLLIPFINFIE